MDVNLRGLHPDFLDELAGGFFPVILLDVDWPDDPAHVHTGYGNLVIGGTTYTGIGASAFQLQLPEETEGLAEFAGQLAVDYQVEWFEAEGVDHDEYVLAADTTAREVKVHFGATTERAGNVLIGAAVEMFRGTMDGFRDIDNRTSRRLEISLRGGKDQRSSANVIVTAQSQADAFPGDTIGRLFESAATRRSGPVKW